MASVYTCNAARLASWWQPFSELGYEVFLFLEDPRAATLGKEILGPAMWDDELIRNDKGGLIASKDGQKVVWVSIRAEPRVIADLPAGMCEVAFGLAGKKTLRSRGEKQLLRDVGRVLQEQGIVEI